MGFASRQPSSPPPPTSGPHAHVVIAIPSKASLMGLGKMAFDVLAIATNAAIANVRMTEHRIQIVLFRLIPMTPPLAEAAVRRLSRQLHSRERAGWNSLQGFLEFINRGTSSEG